jgi:hypothetical protein
MQRQHCATLIAGRFEETSSVKAVMCGMFAVAATIVGIGAIDVLAADPSGRPSGDQPAPLTASPLSGTSSSDLARSGGVITPPAGVDPQIKRMPPGSADPMPVIPPPGGTPGGDQSVKPK